MIVLSVLVIGVALISGYFNRVAAADLKKEIEDLKNLINERDNAYSNLFEKILESYAEIESNNHEFLKVAAETINENMIYDGGMIASIFDTTAKIADFLDIYEDEDSDDEDLDDDIEGNNDKNDDIVNV